MHSLRHRRFVWEIMMNFTIYFTHTTNFITWRNCMLMKSFFSDILFNISAVKEWIIVIEGWCSFFFFFNIVFLCFAFQFYENCHTVVFNLITIKAWTVAIEGYCLYPEIITIPFEGLCIVYGIRGLCKKSWWILRFSRIQPTLLYNAFGHENFSSDLLFIISIQK